ncbi:SH3 domain-containing protein [Bradyrhizobium diazoefficiens]|jgi:alkyl hydroperoxide reductase subunit AhpF|nr:SH3 domain-containing protein [Bradyrhizobium diazoefficiens]MBR0963813.1 SH3 domain-containing protein [Bradyrhizobium diazoefficiens]MBR0977964.1 SH3 domain-containing protein [Bradyrhizobium diazoefficiens]MBR1007474.1 SH3 domain-containing protein [Bradyrhizobium diazoefficiens]MBR1012684.1 SH3 domain-containing protein [Bradyrhizobium diazoefficiens]MBR1051561.1 SH3 domain-containing protein [Bradyrhizobium diazoefficiens]
MRRIIACCAAAIVGILSAQAAPSTDHGQEIADSLSGGPDFWEVRGLGAKDALSLRRAPSAHAPLVTRFANGTVLRNLGCRISSGSRWCRVVRPGDPAVRGWVNGRYLRESSGPN